MISPSHLSPGSPAHSRGDVWPVNTLTGAMTLTTTNVALALRYHFASIRLRRGLPPQAIEHARHTMQESPARGRALPIPTESHVLRDRGRPRHILLAARAGDHEDVPLQFHCHAPDCTCACLR